jgi:hypothetical protein
MAAGVIGTMGAGTMGAGTMGAGIMAVGTIGGTIGKRRSGLTVARAVCYITVGGTLPIRLGDL